MTYVSFNFYVILGSSGLPKFQLPVRMSFIDYQDFIYFLVDWPSITDSRSEYRRSQLRWHYGPLLGLGRFFFSFLIFYTVGSTSWKGDQFAARPLPAHRTAQTENKRTQTPMPKLGFDPTIPVFEREKIVHALDRAATVIGHS
jgi:hypothetical protein